MVLGLCVIVLICLVVKAVEIGLRVVVLENGLYELAHVNGLVVEEAGGL